MCLGCRPSAPTLLFRKRAVLNLQQKQAWVVPRLPPVGSYYTVSQSCGPKSARQTGWVVPRPSTIGSYYTVSQSCGPKSAAQKSLGRVSAVVRRLLLRCFAAMQTKICSRDKPGSCLGCRPSAPTILFRNRAGQNLQGSAGSAQSAPTMLFRNRAVQNLQ